MDTNLSSTSFSSVIEGAKSALILLPNKPYFDQVAAGLSIYLALQDKKPAVISCPAPMVVEFNRLVGVNKIVSEVGNKNLTLTFKGYNASDIEKVSYDIENGEFGLTVVPKPGLAAPTQEQVSYSYSGISADLVLLIGGANESHFPQLAMKELETAKLVHIGTRVLTMNNNRSIMSFARTGSSTSEIVASHLIEGGFTVDHDIATNLVMGIEEGSTNFASAETNADTFSIFGELLRRGGKRFTKPVAANFPAGSIPKEPLIEKKETPPPDWLGEPKIYKGTSVS